LPELIPAHYDMNNQVTRWGSKYETLIFPVITVLFGYFMLAMAKLSSKQEENGSNNKNVLLYAMRAIAYNLMHCIRVYKVRSE
jgi:flagellar basal body-associated protein FliL